MTPEHWQEVKQIFHAALEREPPARREFLDQACGGNKLLLGEVESLLASYELSGEFIDAPAFELATNLLSKSESTPEQIGSYRVLSKLGRGGMGEVYLAEDSRLGRKVALKLLPQTHVNDPDRMRRFEQEARAASALNQPNILTIHEIGDFDGHRYIVTEYIEGQTLRDAMQIQPLTLGESLSVAEQVAAALAVAHSAGIIHRDIKPENIMLRQDGIVKVLDFGLAKLNAPTETGPDDPTQQQINTGSGLVMGTVAYMSPEQARGLKIDARTDIWSLGVVLYEMISGERPFKGSTSSDVLVSVLEREPPPLDIAALGIPETLEFIIAKALTKDFEGRYQSAREFLTDIRRLKQRLNFADELERRGAKAEITDPHVTSPAAQQVTQTDPAMPPGRRNVSRSWLIIVPIVLIGSVGMIYVAGLLWRKEVRPIANAPEILRTTQITTRTGFDVPALSPDGNSIAYSSRSEEEGSELYVKPLTPGAREIQLTAEGAGGNEPAWSPDGKWIAYRSRKPSGIWIIPATGGTARQVTDFGANPAWSSDGSTIVFQSEASQMPPTTIWKVSSQGGDPVQLTKGGIPGGGHSEPAWSPDGRRIVFIAYAGFISGQLWSIDANGGDLRQVSKRNDIWFKGPVYSPDGKFLYTGGVTESGTFVLYRLEITSSTNEATADPLVIKDTGLSYVEWAPTISGDGKKVLYSVRSLNGEIMSVPISSASHEPLGSPKALTQSSGYRKAVQSFSRNGELIAYSQWSGGENQKVWVMNADGTNARQLTSGSDLHWSSTWLPDNDTLVFLSHHGGAQSIKSVSVSTGREKIIRNLSQPIGWARVSPNGQQLAFNAFGSGAMNTWTMPVNGGSPVQLTFDTEGIAWPAWSPDGNMLVVQMKRGANSYIGVMPSSGGEVTQLTSEPGQVQPYDWSPEGDKLVMCANPNGIWNVYWYSLKTKQKKQLTSFTTRNHYIRYPLWSPKGDQIVFEYAETSGTNWLLELK